MLGSYVRFLFLKQKKAEDGCKNDLHSWRTIKSKKNSSSWFWWLFYLKTQTAVLATKKIRYEI